MGQVRLHKITWFLLIAIVWEIAANIVSAAAVYKGYAQLSHYPAQAGSQAQMIAAVIKEFTYTVAFIASAAMVEFLARIWEQLKILNVRQAQG